MAQSKTKKPLRNIRDSGPICGGKSSYEDHKAIRARKKMRAEEIALNELSRKIHRAIGELSQRFLGKAIERGLSSIRPSTRGATIPKRAKSKARKKRPVDFNMVLRTPEDCMRYAAAIREALKKGGIRCQL